MKNSKLILNNGEGFLNNSQHENNEFEQQLKDINEWQENYNNPGHYIGSAKVPTPLKNLFKSPAIILIVGIIITILTLYSIISNFTFENILSNIFSIIISASFIFGGIVRMLNKR